MTPQDISEHAKSSSPVSMWALVIAVPFGGLAGLWFLFAARGRIDSPEEFDMALRLSSRDAAPLALACVFLVFGVTRWLRPSLRLLFTAGVGVAVWLVCSQLLQYSYYSQLRSKGVDPEGVLRSVRPQSRRLNQADAPNPAVTSLFQAGRYWRGVGDLRR